MATVNFSVPDDVKKAFDATFSSRNKSAIIAELMRRAVEDEALKERRIALFEALNARRGRRASATTAQIRNARSKGRP